ncbi:hypothetical protein CDAR_41891 [Caerostris darwini]|uniref:Uncharacterized protein n=1 Tax=Caerostris darwini TaxID=1538125 RepID=A0AAV4V1L1_9ARAC|nr:hypothetical protein CDAR_41891 [Caerostris darwini]
MALEKNSRALAKDVLAYLWYKEVIIKRKDKMESYTDAIIDPDFVDNTRLLIWLEFKIAAERWHYFLSKHFDNMASSTEKFVKYVAFACYNVMKETKNVHRSFYLVLAVIAQFAHFCYKKKRLLFVFHTEDLFCAFFNKELSSNFQRKGGWKKLKKEIEKEVSLKCLKDMLNDGKMDQEIIEYICPEFSDSEEINDMGLTDITREDVESYEEAKSFVKEMTTKLVAEDIKPIQKEQLSFDVERERALAEAVAKLTLASREEVSRASISTQTGVSDEPEAVAGPSRIKLQDIEMQQAPDVVVTSSKAISDPPRTEVKVPVAPAPKTGASPLIKKQRARIPQTPEPVAGPSRAAREVQAIESPQTPEPVAGPSRVTREVQAIESPQTPEPVAGPSRVTREEQAAKSPQAPDDFEVSSPQSIVSPAPRVKKEFVKPPTKTEALKKTLVLLKNLAENTSALINLLKYLFPGTV